MDWETWVITKKISIPFSNEPYNSSPFCRCSSSSWKGECTFALNKQKGNKQHSSLPDKNSHLEKHRVWKKSVLGSNTSTFSKIWRNMSMSHGNKNAGILLLWQWSHSLMAMTKKKWHARTGLVESFVMFELGFRCRKMHRNLEIFGPFNVETNLKTSTNSLEYLEILCFKMLILFVSRSWIFCNCNVH